MFIARTDKFDYTGIENGYYKFKAKDEDSFILVRKAKIVDKKSDMAFILTEENKIEPTYKTNKNFDKKEIDKIYNKIFN